MARQHNDEQSAPSPEGIVGLNIRGRATSKSPILGILPRDAIIDIGEKSDDQKWARIAKIVNGDIAPAQKGGSVPNEARQGWVFLGELEQVTGIPERFDQTYVLPKPYPIKAGELIGHLGEYQRPCEASRLPPQPHRPLLHLEVFSGDEVPAFIEASRKRAAQLADSDKTVFVIETGATLCSPAEPDQMLAADAGVMPLKGETAGKGPWVQVHPMRTQIIERAGLTFSAKDGPHGSYTVGGQRAYFTGRFFGATNQEMTDDESVAREKGYGRREVQIPETTSLWIERRHLGRPSGAPAWQQFPLQLSKTMPPASGQPRTLTKAELNRFDESRKAVDGQGFTWWQVDVGDANGRAVRGWVREKGHPKTGWKSPWDWPGFVTEAETAAPADLMRCQLHRLDAAQNAQEANEFKTAAARVSEGPLLTQLREILDAQDQKDGLISSQDLRKALQQPWLAERLGKLIIRHESEWGGTAAKWDAMDKLMLDGLPNWQAEKQRIEKLKIWDGLQGVEGFPASSNVYHFHPLGMAGNFLDPAQLITFEMLKAAEGGNSSAYYDRILPQLNRYAAIYDLTTPKRIAHFLSQVAHESGLRVIEENLSYSAKQMRRTFGCIGGSTNYDEKTDSCKLGRIRDKLWTQQATYENNPKNLGSYVYADRLGNGDEASGEGYKYRGRGLIQITGRDGYLKFQKAHEQNFPADSRNFVENPDLLIDIEQYGIESAFWFWDTRKLNAVSDFGSVSQVTRLVNGGLNGYADRKARYNRLATLFGLPLEE